MFVTRFMSRSTGLQACGVRRTCRCRAFRRDSEFRRPPSFADISGELRRDLAEASAEAAKKKLAPH